MATPAGKVLTFEEAESRAELRDGITLAKLESEELQSLYEIRALTHEAEKMLYPSSISSSDFHKVYNLLNQAKKLTFKSVEIFVQEKSVYARLLRENNQFMLNLGRLRQAYRGDPKERYIEKLEQAINKSLKELFELFQKNMELFVELQEYLAHASALLYEAQTSGDMHRTLVQTRKIVRQLKDVDFHLLHYTYEIQDELEDLKVLEIKEVHIEKIAEHPLFK